MGTSKILWLVGGIVVIAGLLDLKCKGAAYKMLPKVVKEPVNRIFKHNE